jgi:hypothetical protein
MRFQEFFATLSLLSLPTLVYFLLLSGVRDLVHRRWGERLADAFFLAALLNVTLSLLILPLLAGSVSYLGGAVLLLSLGSGFLLGHRLAQCGLAVGAATSIVVALFMALVFLAFNSFRAAS